jgi:nicotinate phosphoribosyltransferase
VAGRAVRPFLSTLPPGAGGAHYHRHVADQGLLFTDFYQLTMAQLYFQQGMHQVPAQFDWFFRANPDYGGHEAGYCVFAGLEDLLDFVARARLGDDELEHLRGVRSAAGPRLFDEEFLKWLRSAPPFEQVTIRAVPEGRVVHPGTPVAVVSGPLAQVQLLETALLNKLNYPTLVATKAARLRQAARGGPVFEFGMRRGQGAGVDAGTRAAMIGGVDGSSNAGASFRMGFKPVGTHAHSLVQAFMACGGSELDAFRAYARTYPDHCLLLVDTVDTLASGLPNAITVFEELREAGHEPVGIRLDSGDLAYLSVMCARELDRAGFPDVSITLSNQLDELTIWQVLTQIDGEAGRYGVDPERLARRLAYGVGTNLTVSGGAPALDGVFKLVAVRSGSQWRPAMKVSNTPAKTLNPGDKALYRVYDERGRATADLVALASERLPERGPLTLRHPSDPHLGRRLATEEISRTEPLLEDAWAASARSEAPTLEQLRHRREADEEALDPGVLRLLNPHIYHVSLSEELWLLKQRLIEEAGVGPEA